LLFIDTSSIYRSIEEIFMTDMTAAILNSAERRIRVGGFNGFSFREIAADVGVKSSSVHYHFPTKEQLAAAVIRRYTAHVAKLIDEGSADGADPLMVWTRAFRSTVHSKNRMCPAAVLGAGALDLPPEVALEVKAFFKMCLDKLSAAGMAKNAATRFLSTITGALVIANALGEPAAYDRATKELARNSN
jgi:TetR/AcrR family transcriptional regulator, transcriptional repressor for nem operon